MSTMPPGVPQQPLGAPSGQPGAKKNSPLVWILGGIAGFMVLCFIGCSAIAFYASHKLREVANNPGLAMTKMASLLYPDMDVVSSNEATNSITLRDKKTGKQATYKFDNAKGTLSVETADGTVSFGSGAAAPPPAWVPVYPGSTPEGAFSAHAADGNSGTWSFKTSDGADKVILYYQDQLKSAGLNVSMTASEVGGGMVTAEDSGKTRTIIVTAGSSSGATSGSISITEKK